MSDGRRAAKRLCSFTALSTVKQAQIMGMTRWNYSGK
jgi:hypothetical protein